MSHWWWYKEWRCPRGNDAGKSFTLKEFLEIFNDIEDEKDEMLGADTNLEKNITERSKKPDK